MKVALIADIHWGIRNDNSWYTDRQKEFFEKTLIPYLKENGIEIVIILGDWFDRRKYVNYKTLQQSKETLEMLLDSTAMVYMLVGNHDTYYKSTTELNSLNELFSKLPNLSIISETTEIKIDGKQFLFVPWIVPSLMESEAEVIRESTADICCGHFELKGAKMMENIVCQHGYGTKLFVNFDEVFTGHFHKPSDFANCHYIGSPLQYTWNDYGDDKRFMVYDTESGEVETVLTNDIIFVKIYYNDGKIRCVPDVQAYKDKNIKIIVEKKEDPLKYEKFIKGIESQDPYRIDIIEQHLYYDDCETDKALLDKDTLSIMLETVDEMQIPKDDIYDLKMHIQSLYSEAQQNK